MQNNTIKKINKTNSTSNKIKSEEFYSDKKFINIMEKRSLLHLDVLQFFEYRIQIYERDIKLHTKRLQLFNEEMLFCYDKIKLYKMENEVLKRNLQIGKEEVLLLNKYLEEL